MASRRKHVALDLDDVQLGEGCTIARVLEARGGNQMEVELPSGRRTLCLMPAKFNKKLWVRKGGFVVLEESEQAAAGDSKITGTILQVLYEDQIKQLRKTPGAWPPEFDSPQAGGASTTAQQGAAGVSSSSDVAHLSAAVAGVSLEQGGRGKDDVGSSSNAAAGAAQRREAPGQGSEGLGIGAQGQGSGQAGQGADGEEEEEEEDDLPPLFQNTNRKVIYHEVTDSESEDDE